LKCGVLMTVAMIALGGHCAGLDNPPPKRLVQQKNMDELKTDKTFAVGGDPDWMAVAKDSVWVSISSLNRVSQLHAKQNRVGHVVAVADPCSGLVAAFGSLWVPSCGKHTLLRVDLKTGKVSATIPSGPADSEGCIAAGAGSIWLATNTAGVLSRFNPKTNTLVASIAIPSGSFCPVFAGGFVWISSTEHSVLTKVDPSTNQAVAQIPVGKNPRFVTAGAGSVWCLNQGDGTISRVDASTGKLAASIDAGLAGHGGEIAFGFDAVWVTLMKFPVTRIDVHRNVVSSQWAGPGGDSIRAGHGSIWLTNLKAGIVWRISPSTL
jgi:virginiamycin B lyase